MPDYMKMYSVLFNAITDALRAIENSQDDAKEILMCAQQKAEEIYIETYDEQQK